LIYVKMVKNSGDDKSFLIILALIVGLVVGYLVGVYDAPILAPSLEGSGGDDGGGSMQKLWGNPCDEVGGSGCIKSPRGHEIACNDGKQEACVFGDACAKSDGGGFASVTAGDCPDGKEYCCQKDMV
jgi:hypothetical protein